MLSEANSGQPGHADIQAALTRIVNQPDFQSSTRLCEFLRFIVNEALSGRSGDLKAFSIAVAVYGRDETFDAQSNSIVRVEATRLRRLLDRYYSGDGAEDPVIISIPRGGYAPEFAFRDQNPSGLENSPVSPAGDTAEPVVKESGGFAKIAAGIVLAAALAGGGFLIARYSAGNGANEQTQQALTGPTSHQPTIQVEMTSFGSGAPSMHDIQNRLAMEHALDRFEDVMVVESGAPNSRPPDYRLRVIPAGSGKSGTSYVVRMVHNRSGEIIWSQPLGQALAGDTNTATLEATQQIAEAIARPFGVIFSDQRRRLRNQSASRYGCIIESYLFFARPTQSAYESAKTCVENAIKEFPQFGAGLATLSLLYTEGWKHGFDQRPAQNLLEESNQLAHRAQLLNPASIRSNLAVFQSEFYRKNYASAFQIGDSLIENNPNSPLAKITIASAYAVQGHAGKAKPLFASVRNSMTNFTTAYGVYLFLLAYAEGDAQEASRWAMSRGASIRPLGLFARILVNHQQGRLEEARQYAERLQKTFPAVFENVPAMLDRYHMAEPLRSKLLTDLKATGLISTLQTYVPPVKANAGSPDKTVSSARN